MLALACLPAASLADCVDEGPWPCAQPPCAAAELSCALLAEQRLCATRWAAVPSLPPAPHAHTLLRALCPRACGQCGVSPPPECNMRQLDSSHATSPALPRVLRASSEPIIVRAAASAWRLNLSQALAARGALPLRAVISGGRHRADPTADTPLLAADFAPALRNGSLPADAYIFHELGGIAAADEGARAVLGGRAVEEEARALLRELPPLSALLARVLVEQQRAAERQVDGRLLLSAGGWANGRPFHVHGPALFALASGAKHWLVRRPNASFGWQTYEVDREELAANERLPDGWEDQLWQCTQREGDLLWVPDQLAHATLNYAGLTTGLTMVIDEVAPLSPLHLAARSGSAAAVRTALRRGTDHVDARARSNGDATPLHFAAGLGHCEAAAELLAAGASPHARAKDGVTALHVAAAGGHEDAVRLLLQHGANAAERNDNGHTPADLAELLGHKTVADALKDAPAWAAQQ
ncbi:hypothetical protein AB1Y20_010712 [Prymnesium parvum]|uniref:Bifunctional lysine-specific demethylase and histidyl-hydroxylase n=1 Tax=Prymnesium parvum TaxID=97485 RepID=A0AB34IQC0_PRYPA